MVSRKGNGNWNRVAFPVSDSITGMMLVSITSWIGQNLIEQSHLRITLQLILFYLRSIELVYIHIYHIHTSYIYHIIYIYVKQSLIALFHD